MRCNPQRWVWGLVPMLGLGGLMHLGGVFAGVEADLRNRGEAALAAAGHSWTALALSGRDAVVAGQAADHSDQLRAGGIVRSVWGVRKLDDQIKLLDEEKNYVWTAHLRNDGKLRLSGHVPNAQARQAIVGAVRATFAGRDIDDRMKLARGVPNQDVWIGGISFAIKQLASLKTGARADLEGTGLMLEGEADDLNAYRDIKMALQDRLPQGIRLKSDKVTPPVVKPYIWSARVAGAQVQLMGHVPNERARDEIFSGAKRAFPKAAVVDRQQIAAGEPRDWLQVARVALAKLGRLDEGSAEIRDSQLTLTGLAPDDTVAGDIRRALKSDLPASFKTAEAIRVKEPAVRTVDPFVTGAEVTAGAVTLTGYAPSAAARAALVESAKARLPGSRIDDRLEVAAGAPETWQACAEAGLLGLGRLKGGRMQLISRALEVAGSTEDEALSQSLAGEVRSAAGTLCATEVKVAFAGVPVAEIKRRADADAAAAFEEAARRVAARKMEAPVDRCQALLTEAKTQGAITFKRASAEIEAASNATLAKLAQVMGTCKSVRVEVQGHTDAEGTPERKQSLSERRAQSVLTYLTGAGVDPERLTAVGYGDARPVAPNDTPESRARNRRIEFEVKPE